MLKVTLNNKLGQVRVGNTTFDLESLKGLKKEVFDKRYKGILDTKETWKKVKKYTK